MPGFLRELATTPSWCGLSLRSLAADTLTTRCPQHPTDPFDLLITYLHVQEQIGPFLAYKQLVVCNYAKGGNAAGKAMYKLGEPCSECDEGFSCDGDLCARQ